MGDLVQALVDPARPCFTFGACPPREGTTSEQAIESARKFSDRGRFLATDGYIVYDIQDEAGRTSKPRPFPYKATIDPAEYGRQLFEHSGKQCVIYKAVGEPSIAAFDEWLDTCQNTHGHNALNLVGAATSKVALSGPTMADAADRVVTRPNCEFGCVTIAERHVSKGNEHLNIQRKVELGAEWFISQAVYDSDATISLLNDYGALCRSKGLVPKKVVLTFAPCGRRKTMEFIKWLGVSVPQDVEEAILVGAPNPPEGVKPVLAEVKAASAVSVKACVGLLGESLDRILSFTASSGVPLGINVESVSGYAEECEASYALFEVLQRRLLNHYFKLHWQVRWEPCGPAATPTIKDAVKEGEASSAAATAAQLTCAAGAGALVVLVALKLKGNKV
mmetsp:Transcript_21893/g.43150  ORF Transcript_21893/g.43150 Transcript_21893/m.43150 type:complete len:392 (+) Transcript_21893:16-1191(+)